METITMKVWRQTHNKIKILAAYGEKSMLDMLEEVVQTALEREEEQRRSYHQRKEKERERSMGEEPTILERTQEIRERYQRGDITPEEAKRLIKPYYDEYIKVAKEKAKAAGMKAPAMSLQKFLSRRSDLRYVAQQHASEQREQP